MDVKDWPVITNPKKYAGQKIIFGTVKDGYHHTIYKHHVPAFRQYGKCNNQNKL